MRKFRLQKRFSQVLLQSKTYVAFVTNPANLKEKFAKVDLTKDFDYLKVFHFAVTNFRDQQTFKFRDFKPN